MDTLNTHILMGTTERAATFRGICLPGEIARNVAGIEYAKALGAFAASSGERNHRPSCLRIEGIEESRFPVFASLADTQQHQIITDATFS